MLHTHCRTNDTLSPPESDSAREVPRPVLIVVEGILDVEFLRRLTAKLHLQDPTIPDLNALDQAQQVIFIPFGGGHVLPWTRRFEALQLPEFHLYDRELEPESALRRQAVELINNRPQCRALLIGRRSLENYLHLAAIIDAGGGLIQLDRDEDIAAAVAREWYLRKPHDRDWTELTPRARRGMIAHAKRWLNTAAVEHMTLGLLIHMDPAGDLIAWLREIARAAGDN